MKCLYCEEEIKTLDVSSLLVERDVLCKSCRSAMKYHHQLSEIEGMTVESFYEYDSLFKTLLLQYKECYDEALAPLFLLRLKDYIRLCYFGYYLIYPPSTRGKYEQRGFEHLELIFKDLGMKMLDGLSLKEELVQEGKDFKSREAMKDNFIYEGDRVDKVLIVDDVLTSGSTMAGVKRALGERARVIKGLALAKV